MKRCRWFLPLPLVWSGLAFGAQGEIGIVHDPIECWPVDQFLLIQSSFVPPDDIQTAKFYFRSTDHPDYYYVELSLGPGGGRAIAPKAEANTPGVTYYLELVTLSYTAFRTEERNVPVASGAECKRRDPETAYYSGQNPDIAVGATRAGATPMPPGFQADGISRLMNVIGTEGAIGGGGISGKTVGIIAGLGGAGAAALALSGGGSSETTTSAIGGITSSISSSSSTSSAIGGVTSTTTTVGGGGSTTSSATTTIGGGSTTTIFGSTTTVVGGSTTTVIGSSTTTVVGSSTTTSVGTSSTTTVIGSSTTTSVVGSSTTTSVGTSSTTSASSTTTSVGTSTTTRPSTTTSVGTSTTSSAGSTTTTSTPSSTSSSTTTRPTTTVASGADLVVTKSGSPGSVRLNQTIQYTVRVTNRGPSTATAVVASDTLPVGVQLIRTNPSCGGSTLLSCSLGTIPVNGVATLVIDVVYVTRQPGPLVNRVSAFGRELDPIPGNNVASASTGVLLKADDTDSGVSAVSYQTELTLERARRPVSGFVLVNNAQLQQVGAGGPLVFRAAAEAGTNHFEAYMEPGAAHRGLWRFDFRGSDRVVAGSLKVESGRPVSLDDRSVVFALDGDTRIRFSVDLQ